MASTEEIVVVRLPKDLPFTLFGDKPELLRIHKDHIEMVCQRPAQCLEGQTKPKQKKTRKFYYADMLLMNHTLRLIKNGEAA